MPLDPGSIPGACEGALSGTAGANPAISVDVPFRDNTEGSLCDPVETARRASYLDGMVIQSELRGNTKTWAEMT